jgi:hypothetical protein
MTVQIPPGFIYLLNRLPRLLLTPIVVYVAANFVNAWLPIQIAGSIIILLSLLSLPAIFAGTIFYTDHINARRAAALGAVFPQQIPNEWPGGLSTLKIFVERFQMGIPGVCP